MAKNSKRKYLFPILTILWTAMIFSFSLQSGEDSSSISSGLGRWIVQTFLPFAEDLLLGNWEVVHLLVRKAAHFTEFLILGLLVSGSVSGLVPCLRFRHKAIAWLICVLVASCDETIQLFVGGRAGRVTDVLLDSCGALVGVLIFTIFCKKDKR